MNSQFATGASPARRARAKALLAAGLGLTVLTAWPAQAQYYGPDRYYYPDYDMPPPGPDVYGPGAPGGPEGPEGLSGIPLSAIRQLVQMRGLRLIAAPRRKGRIYLAETEDGHGIRHRLVFDAYQGRVIEDTVLGPKRPLPSPYRTTLPKPPQRPQTDQPSKTVLEPQDKDKDKDKVKDKENDKDQVKTDKPATDTETPPPPPPTTQPK